MSIRIAHRNAVAAGFASALILGVFAFTQGCSSSNSSSTSYHYRQTNLVSDQASGASHTDANLLNPWGIAYGPSTGFLVANNHSGTATEYDGSGVALPATPLVITVPPPLG